MKILQILPELNSGGVERGTLEIAHFLAREGHGAMVVSNGGRMVATLENGGARHFKRPVHRKSPLSLLQVSALRKLIRQEKPDIVHARSRVPAWIAWLAWRGLKPGERPRFVTTVHGFNSVNLWSSIMARGERVIAVSDCIRDFVLKSYPKTRPEIIRVIPRGVELDDYPHGFRPADEWLARWRQEHPRLVGRTVFLLPGRITRLKGHEDFFDLIQALRREGRNVHGLVVGDVHPKKRAYLAELEAKVKSAGLLDDITFAGHRSDLREVMAVSDVVCSLSTQPESFGRTTLEALALGRKVLAYDHGGVAEQLRRFYPSGLAPLGDAEALLSSARRILDGDQLPEQVVPPYTLEAMCRSTLAVYQELLGGIDRIGSLPATSARS